MPKTLTSYVDVDAIRAQWKAMHDDLYARLPEKDAHGKPVKKEDHKVPEAKLDSLVSRAVTGTVLAEVAEDMKSEIKAAVKKS